MADATVLVDDPLPPPQNGELFNSGLATPPLDATFFSEHMLGIDDPSGNNQNDDVVIEDLDFDFSFDDLCLPSSDDLDDLLNPTGLQQSNFPSGLEADFCQFEPNFDQLHGVFKSNSKELHHLTGDGDLPADHSWEGSGVLSPASPEMEPHQISGYLNMQSPESNGSNPDGAESCDPGEKGLNCRSPESQGSGNFGSNVSEDSNNRTVRSVSSSPNSSKSSIRTGVVDQNIKLEEPGNNKNSNNSLLKRKKEGEDLIVDSVDSRVNKSRKSNCDTDNDNSSNDNDGLTEDDEKRKARLLRNRESAQLSRQRKKHYVVELEDKVRTMHSTIQDLNAKISYFMAENVTLRQQMGGGGAAAAAVPPPPMVPPPPGMYPHPAMMYPWMPCPPPYMMKPQGSHVPLVPIPRLKTQQPSQPPKINKKTESKKKEGPKTKKVAGVSFLGLLFFIMLFGGLVPMVNVRYGGVREVLTGGESYTRGGFNEKHRGRVLMVNGTGYGEKHGGKGDFSSGSNSSVHCGQRGDGSGVDPSEDEFAQSRNGSEPLAASLYVPRNDKLVKIDGNLIIHSVLASEKAMASSHGNGGGETGLVVSGDLAPAISVSVVGRNGAIHPQLRAIGSGSAVKDSVKSSTTDGRLQQWFREGLAGPMLSAGMCSEVFQFDVSAASPPVSMVPATTTRNISEEINKNSTHLSKGTNRRFLHPIPLPESSRNVSTEHSGRSSEKEDLNGNHNTSSMVVSVLFDPREAGDADVDGVMGTKSLTRIFVVVLIDSVKYVTYSCMLPFKGSAHLVTT